MKEISPFPIILFNIINSILIKFEGFISFELKTSKALFIKKL